MNTRNTVSTRNQDGYERIITSSSMVVSASSPSDTLKTASYHDYPYTIASGEDYVRKMIEEYLMANEPTVYRMTCQSCGAPIDQRIDDHILKCPFCKSEIPIEATRCPHCTSELPEEE